MTTTRLQEYLDALSHPAFRNLRVSDHPRLTIRASFVGQPYNAPSHAKGRLRRHHSTHPLPQLPLPRILPAQGTEATTA